MMRSRRECRTLQPDVVGLCGGEGKEGDSWAGYCKENKNGRVYR